MTHLLDLEPVEDRPRKPRRLPKPVGLLVVGVVLLALVVGVVLGGRALLGLVRSDAPDYEGSGTGEVVVQVQQGDTASDVAATLFAEGVVRSAAAFVEAALDEPRSRSIQPGYYRLRERMRAALALELLLDPAARLRGRVVLPEGLTVEQSLQRIAQSSEVPLADLRAAAANPAALGLPPYAGGRLEGFLYPATYDVEPRTTAVEVLRTMVARYEEAAAETDLVARAQQLGRTPYEIVIIASLIERESRVADELPKVSRVIYNRLERRMPLGIDATILYGLGRTSGSLRQSELARDTPYNTRLRRGLPPTPIANPGQAALEAALAPEPGDWLYYVLASKDGRHLFTADYDEFLRQKAKSQREGVF